MLNLNKIKYDDKLEPQFLQVVINISVIPTDCDKARLVMEIGIGISTPLEALIYPAFTLC